MSQLNWEEKYRRLEANIPGMVYRFAMHADGSFSFPYVNGASRQLFHVGPEELMADAGLIMRLIHPDDLARFHATVLRSARTLEPWRQELRHVVGGEVRWYDCMSRPEKEENGDIVWDGIILEITDRKRTEEALRQANLIVENSPVVLFRWRATEGWPVEMVSRNVIRFGYTPEELLSGAIPFASIVHPQDLQRVAAEVRGYVARGCDQFQQEYRIVTKNGEIRWIYDRTVVERDPAGKINHYQGIVIDITDRKRTESIMEARLRLLQFAETHTLDDLLEATLDEAEALTGSLIGFYHFLEADQKTLALQNWSTRTKRDCCKAEGKGLHYDVSQAGVWVDCILQRRPVIHNDYASLPHRKGVPADHAPLVREMVVPVLRGNSIVAILGVGNKPTEYCSRDVETVSLMADLAWSIVERKKSEEALKESEEKFRVLAETAPTAIVVCQGERTVYVNSAAIRLFGYSEEELMAMKFWECAEEESRESVRERELARQRGEAVPSQYKYRFRNREGETGWAMVSAGTIEYRGRPAGIATLMDITEAKRAEELLQTSLAEKEVLLKEVHHRVKNNLQIISSLLYLQSESIPEERSRAYFRESENRVRSMALIHERLYGSKNFSSIDFGHYIGDLSRYLFDTYAADTERISLNVNGAGGSLGINEAVPCGLIVNELLSNCLKHAFPHDRCGEISIRMGRGADGWITLTVADTGIGLPPGLDFGNTETLGLQLVNTLVKQLRGQLTVGGEGRGAVIAIRFPGNGKREE